MSANHQTGLRTGYRSRAETAALEVVVLDILRAGRPMTLRQLYYQLISRGSLPNSQRAYRSLIRLTVRMRDAGRFPRSWLRDSLRRTLRHSSWSGLEDFAEQTATLYRKDFWSGQPSCPLVLIEKDALAAACWPACSAYDVALGVARGNTSQSYADELASEWKRIAKPVHVYYAGDHDPSGYGIELDFQRKLAAYSGRELVERAESPQQFDWCRLAVTAEDIERFGLVRLKAKRSDPRYRRFVAEHGTVACELDALPAVELRQRITTAIEALIDQAAWAQLKAQEAAERELYVATVGKLRVVEGSAE